MAVPVAVIAGIVTSLIKGPLASILESHLKDAEARRKLAADIEAGLLSHLGKALDAQSAVVLTEAQSEHWLTRSWRPLTMLSFLGILMVLGLVLPLADLLAGYRLPFEPRWADLPAPFWDFMAIGMGGYIGGRSLEKIAGEVLGGKRRK